MTAPDASTDAGIERPEIATDDTDLDAGGDPTTDSRATERYRRRLQESRTETADVQAKHDALATRVETLQRREVERIVAAADVVRPAAIWAGGVRLADLLDDAGDVDTELVQAATQAAIAELGLSTQSRMKPDRSQGARNPGGESTAGGWARILGATQTN